MKKIGITILFSLLCMCIKAQTPKLNTLIRFVSAPIANITEGVISKKGWELTESKNVDSIVNLRFDNEKSTLVIKRIKDYENEVYFICTKPQYDALYESILALKPKLINSKVNENGNIVRTYFGQKYMYKITIAPKSLFSIAVFDKGSYYMSHLFDDETIKSPK